MGTVDCVSLDGVWVPGWQMVKGMKQDRDQAP